MSNDEQLIRDIIAAWQRATASGDLPLLLGLMAEDVVFLAPGRPPMRGRGAFAAGFQAALEHYRLESSCEVQEIQVAGDWASCWSYLVVNVMPAQAGPAKRLSGYTLTVLRKKADGAWVIARDANMLTEG